MQCSRSFTGIFNDVPEKLLSLFTGIFNDVPEKLLSPLDYFSKFFPDTLLEAIEDQTSLYSVQKSLKSVDTNVDKMKTLIGMEILVGIIKSPSYRN